MAFEMSAVNPTGQKTQDVPLFQSVLDTAKNIGTAAGGYYDDAILRVLRNGTSPDALTPTPTPTQKPSYDDSILRVSRGQGTATYNAGANQDGSAWFSDLLKIGTAKVLDRIGTQPATVTDTATPVGWFPAQPEFPTQSKFDTQTIVLALVAAGLVFMVVK